jgi:hypothetical protein
MATRGTCPSTTTLIGELTPYPIQYRSEVATSGSSGIAIAGSSPQLRANSAGVAQSSAEWGQLSLY